MLVKTLNYDLLTLRFCPGSDLSLNSSMESGPSFSSLFATRISRSLIADSFSNIWLHNRILSAFSFFAAASKSVLLFVSLFYHSLALLSAAISFLSTSLSFLPTAIFLLSTSFFVYSSFLEILELLDAISR